MRLSRALLTTAVVTAMVGAVPAVAAQAATAAAPPPVAHLSVTAQSATTVTLSWTNPRSSRFRGVEIRGTSRTGVLPATPKSNGHVVRTIAKYRSYTVRKLAPGTRYGFSVFATDGHGHYARRESVFATTAPAPATSPAAYDLTSAIRVSWVNSHTHTFRRVVVRLAKGSAAPATPSAGKAVTTTSAAASSVDLGGLAADTRYSVSIFAEDAAHRFAPPAIVRFTTAPPAVGGGGIVTGRVLDQQGDPLAGAVVGSPGDFLTGSAPVTTTTGADGRYTLHLAAGPAEVDAGGDDLLGGSSDAGGYQPNAAFPTVLAGKTTTADIVLAPGAAVTVHVTDTAGQPIGGATVTPTSTRPYVETDDGDGGGGISFFDVSQDPAQPPVTGIDGTATLRGLDPTDPLRVCASKPDGYLDACTTKPTVLTTGTVADAPDLALAPGQGASITGRVVGGTHALPGVEIDVSGEVDEDSQNDGTDGFGYSAGVTASDGTFSAVGLPAGRYSVCAESYTATGPGYAPACSTTFTVGAGAAASAGTITEPLAGAISGTVTAPGGHGVADAFVTASTKGDDGDQYGQAVTDRYGHFRIAGLPHRALELCVSPQDDAIAGSPTGVQGGCVAGGATVTPRPGYIRTGLDVTLARGGAVSGIVRDSSGHPVANEVLDIGLDNSDADGDTDAIAFSDRHGRFSVAGLAPGSYLACDLGNSDGTGSFAFSIVSDGGAECPGKPFTVRVGATTPVTVTVAARSSITVTVHDTEGTPVGAVDATAIAPCSDDNDEDTDCDQTPVFNAKTEFSVDASAMTHSDGTTTLTGLAAGTYAVCLWAYYGTTISGGSPTGYADGCSGTTFTVTVAKASTATVALTLAPGGAVSGHITDADGHAVAGVQVIVSNSAATDDPDGDFGYDGGFDDDPADAVPGQDEVSGADGSYSVIGVQTGRQTVCAAAEGVGTGGGYLDRCHGDISHSEDGTPVVVVAGSTTTGVDIALTAGAELRGTARARNGKGLDDIEVDVFAGRTTDGQVAEVQTSGSGTWSVTQLPAGSYTVCFSSFAIDSSGHTAAGACWKGVVWPKPYDTNPPLSKATAIPVATGAVVSGIDATLAG